MVRPDSGLVKFLHSLLMIQDRVDCILAVYTVFIALFENLRDISILSFDIQRRRAFFSPDGDKVLVVSPERNNQLVAPESSDENIH